MPILLDLGRLSIQYACCLQKGPDLRRWREYEMKISPTNKRLETIPMASQDAGDGRAEGGYGEVVQSDQEESPSTLRGLFRL